MELLKEIGANFYRFSVEWSRIEPDEGRFNGEAVLRYRRFVDHLLKAGITPMITLHHFTNPIWFYATGGWLREDSPIIFGRYAAFVSSFFPDVPFWITVNEPNVFAYQGYVIGAWPPGKRSITLALKVVKNMLKAHVRAYGEIKRNVKGASVGIAHHMRVFQPVGLLGRIPAFLRDYTFNFLPVYAEVKGRILPPAGFESLGRTGDFIGINYYTKDRVRFSPKDPFGVEVYPEGVWRNSLGWEVYPRGIYETVKRFSFGKPVIITENGIATESHSERVEFVSRHLRWLKRAKGEGINVKGYLYWSLLDNYEWLDGYSAKFGIFTRTREKKGDFNIKELWERA